MLFQRYAWKYNSLLKLMVCLWLVVITRILLAKICTMQRRCFVLFLHYNLILQTKKNPSNNIENALVNLIFWVGGKELAHAEAVIWKICVVLSYLGRPHILNTDHFSYININFFWKGPLELHLPYNRNVQNWIVA